MSRDTLALDAGQREVSTIQLPMESENPARLKNILLVTVDQWRFDFVTGGAVASLETPHLDRLRRGGVSLPNAYATCPVCMPARFAWLHGLRPSQFSDRLVRNARDWPEPGSYPTMAEALQRRGYRTSLVGKLHSEAGLYHRDLREMREVTQARGFDDVVEVSGKMLSWWFDCEWTAHLEERGLLDQYRRTYRPIGDIFAYRTPTPSFLEPQDTMDGFIAGRALEWLNNYREEAPLFLHVSFCGPHFPLDPPKEYYERFADEDMPPPEGVEDAAEIARWKGIRRSYCGLIAQLDDELGRLLDVVEARGWSEETLIVFCSDHGDMLGHRGRGHKSQPYDTSCRTPIYAMCPGALPAGKVNECLVESVDLPLTLLEWAGLEGAEVLPGTPGRSFLGSLRDSGRQHREWLYAEGRDWRMALSDGYKYVHRRSGDHELYALEDDPWELENRVGERGDAERVRELRGRLIDSLLENAVADREAKAAPRDDWLERKLRAEGEPWASPNEQ